MKNTIRTMSLLIVIVLLFGLFAGCASQQSAEARKADELIQAIGTVSLDNAAAVALAEGYYATLTQKQQSEVTKIQVLQDARATLNELQRAKEEEEAAIAASIAVEESIAEEEASKVLIPDLAGVDADDGKNVLTSNSLIPILSYEYSEKYKKGQIISCDPPIGEKVEKNTKVTIVVSKGPETVYAIDARIRWTSIGYDEEDEWNFYAPYIKDGYLHIECYPVTFGTTIKWKDENEEGSGFGLASITDTFNKTVPASVEYENQTCEAGVEQYLVIKIPLADLNTEFPTDMYVRLRAIVDDKEKDVSLYFSMTWGQN